MAFFLFSRLSGIKVQCALNGFPRSLGKIGLPWKVFLVCGGYSNYLWRVRGESREKFVDLLNFCEKSNFWVIFWNLRHSKSSFEAESDKNQELFGSFYRKFIEVIEKLPHFTEKSFFQGHRSFEIQCKGKFFILKPKFSPKFEISIQLINFSFFFLGKYPTKSPILIHLIHHTVSIKIYLNHNCARDPFYQS